MSESGRARTWVLAFILLAGAGFGTLVGVGCAIHANAWPCRSPQKQTATDGPTLFLANCAVCHGREGRGGTGPSLIAGQGGALSPDELIAKIRRGKPLAGMPMFKRELNEQQIAAVADFVLSLRSPEPSPTP
ncbi:MAG: cytochrome c [Actinomycetota bacterium]|nr:cytochrome c [Actinomycetota bacterium]